MDSEAAEAPPERRVYTVDEFERLVQEGIDEFRDAERLRIRRRRLDIEFLQAYGPILAAAGSAYSGTSDDVPDAVAAICKHIVRIAGED